MMCFVAVLRDNYYNTLHYMLCTIVMYFVVVVCANYCKKFYYMCMMFMQCFVYYNTFHDMCINVMCLL